MKIQATAPNFNGKVDINRLRRMNPAQAGEFTAKSSALGSLTGAVSTASTAGSASSSLAGGSEVIGTAFVSKGSGINSSGIVPSVMEVATPHLTPASVISTNNHPSIIGSMFSTIGSWFSNVSVKTKNIKNPS